MREAVVTDIKQYAERHAKDGGSMQTQVMLDLFRDNAAGLAPREVARIYEEEYSRVKTAKKNPFALLLPNIGWVVAAILMVLLIFRDLLKEWLTRLFKAAGEKIYGKLAGKPFFWRAALRHYQQSLRGKYTQLHIPFRPHRPLSMREIYVPLKVADSAGSEQTEAYQLVISRHRSMIKGAPGSGKSMLLKHLVLSYAEGRMEELPDRPVPVLMELHRFNDPKATFEDLLVAELARNDFPRAQRFVASALEQGHLMLLLDGLDEVNSSERKRVVRHIKDLLERHKKCRAIITCRAAIYRGEFDDSVGQTLEIAEFNDQQLRRFLGSWEQDMVARNKSTEQLMQTLRDRPLIMALARNPLLLTIIAYLYTDTEFVLPNSRAEFYRRATDILLDLWHREHNRFKASDKRMLLQHLGLFNQDATGRQGQQDRLSMERSAVLLQARQFLPFLNLDQESADAFLDEIIERSGLLLTIDGGERYQFAHLTLQEYFAATELSEHGERLLERFRLDHDTWRETVKLWCGLDHESTGFIQAIYAEDPLTGFECLADAQKVQSGLAEEILAAFKSRLEETGVDDAVIKAFGAVASDSRSRGEAVFSMLTESLSKARDTGCRTAIADALSLTNRPQAAQVLAGYYTEHAEIRAALVRMGDLAVPAIAPMLEARPVDTLDDLLAIGTPHAAKVLVPWLWHSDKELSMSAAWRMASMLQKPGVEDVLRDYTLTLEQRKASYIGWIWQPFNEPERSALPVIAGRVAFLLEHAPAELAPAMQSALDPRLVVPLCAILRRAESGLSSLWNMPGEARQLWTRVMSALRTGYPERVEDPILLTGKNDSPVSRTELMTIKSKEIRTPLDATPAWFILLGGLPPEMVFKLLRRLNTGKVPFRKSVMPTEADWRHIFRPVEYDFDKSWRFRAIFVMAAILSGVAVVYAILTIDQSQSSVFGRSNFLLLVAALWAGLFWMRGLNELKIFSDPDDFLLGAVVMPLFIPYGLGLFVVKPRKMMKEVKSLDWVDIRTILLGAGWLPATGYLGTAAMLMVLSWPQVVLVWGLLLGVSAMLWRTGKWRDRKARNPLQGLLEPPRGIVSRSGRTGGRLSMVLRLRHAG
ncbi:NACHT domain-containing protein [Archangium lansingense]|uniref:NACHT domain-containing protein n=1 Tax=Archangium lansingense TaxID=2995310 RepID=UPI003B768353